MTPVIWPIGRAIERDIKKPSTTEMLAEIRPLTIRATWPREIA